MRQQLEQRLKELRAEFEAGQKMLADLEAKQTNLKNTLLRISGAIQVLEEFLTGDASAADSGEHSLDMHQNSRASRKDEGKEASGEPLGS